MITDHQMQEIDERREHVVATRRETVPALEEILYKPLPVLNHGFVRVIDYMGCDAAIVQAARVSYGKGTKKLREDEGLIRYLMRHRHTTPFEMCEIKLHVKLPIFVARQWIRHRTANVNEYSARYSVLDREFYVPDDDHMGRQSKSNRQGRGDALLKDDARLARHLIESTSRVCHQRYTDLLQMDLAREIARSVLSVNFYTQWYWKIDLHNLMHFLELRTDPHAQYEIRAYADVIDEIMLRWVPITHKAFVDYRKQAVTISRQGLSVMRDMIEGKKVTKEDYGMSEREWNELMSSLGMES